MTSYKEPQVMRPLHSHRLSMSSTPSSSTPQRQSTSRHHSYSVSLGAPNTSHRITRRKSMNASAVNSAAAVAAALQDGGAGTSKRRSLNMKNTGSSRGVESSKHTESTYERDALGEALASDANVVMDNESAVADDFLSPENTGSVSKAKARRASEGSYLTKGEGKRSSGELRCEKCGKGYKHSSCLTKHLWEHTPEWSYTSKLLISKHQQVQLLEAASVLVGMNLDEPTEPETAKTTSSDQSSASPAASGSSDILDDEDYSSAETTPPPISEHYSLGVGTDASRRKRYSGNSSSYSRSYQSAPFSSLPNGSAFANYQQQQRPATSGMAPDAVDEEEASLVAAVETLCTFGTPSNGPVLLPADVPPVPPLPARYAEENFHRLSGHIGPFAELGLPAPSYPRLSDERDMKMSDEQRHDDYDHDDHPMSHGRSDEDDDGVFGVMEGVSHEHHAY